MAQFDDVFKIALNEIIPTKKEINKHNSIMYICILLSILITLILSIIFFNLDFHKNIYYKKFHLPKSLNINLKYWKGNNITHDLSR